MMLRINVEGSYILKSKSFIGFASVLSAVVLLLSASEVIAAEKAQIVIGSGGRTGVYYPVAIAICRLVNAKTSEHNTKCSVESTKGSVNNLNQLRENVMNFAIVQSDWQSHAFKGTNVFEEAGPHQELRSVFSLYPEAFTVLARAKSKINNIHDLVNRRVNIGNPGSGQRATMEILMEAMGWNQASFSLIQEFNSQSQSQVLCDKEVDAIVFVAGHPSGSIKQATTQCDAKIINVTGKEIDALIERNDFYRKATIPKGMYRDHTEDAQTFGVSATLVSVSNTSDELVEAVVSSVFGALGEFKMMHPALEILNASEMVKDGLAAPLHTAANAYYKKQGY